MSMLSSKTVDTVIVATTILVVLFLVAWFAAPVLDLDENLCNIIPTSSYLKYEKVRNMKIRPLPIHSC